MVTIQEAAKSLHEQFRDATWLTMVGVGEHNGRESIFVYVKSLDPAHVGFLKGGWCGFPVVIRKMTSPRPVLR